MEIVNKIVLAVVLVIVIMFIFAFPTMLLWNAVMPDIFGLGEIGFWQTVGLMLLARFLFGFGTNTKHG